MRKSFRVQHTWPSTALKSQRCRPGPVPEFGAMVLFREAAGHMRQAFTACIQKTSTTSSGLLAFSGGRLEQQSPEQVAAMPAIQVMSSFEIQRSWPSTTK